MEENIVEIRKKELSEKLKYIASTNKYIENNKKTGEEIPEYILAEREEAMFRIEELRRALNE